MEHLKSALPVIAGSLRHIPDLPDISWEMPQTKQLMQTLKSDAFREKLLAMGGYIVENPGQIIPL